MYKTGTKIELTYEVLSRINPRDFLPIGTVRKAKLLFKNGTRKAEYDIVLQDNGGTLGVFLSLPNNSDKVGARYIRYNWYRGYGCLLEEGEPGVLWFYSSCSNLVSWLRRYGTPELSITLTEKPVKPERLKGINTCFNTIHKDVKNEIGSELELEATTRELSEFRTNSLREKVEKIARMSLVDNIGNDCSVAGYGPEIRFRHPALGKWRKDAISRVISGMKEIGFSAGPSAGQHVHISHPKIRLAIYKCKMDIDGMNEFLKPISCRRSARYGVGDNIIRDQFKCFKTLEIRVWESTTNVGLFKKRLRFSNELVKCLLRRDVDYRNIWKKMSKSMGEDYVDMLFIDNPHQIGLGIQSVMARLPYSLVEYAHNKYGYCSEQQYNSETTR